VHGSISDTYQFGDKRYRLPPGSNVWHAVDVAVERVVSRVSGKKDVVKKLLYCLTEINMCIPYSNRLMARKILY
jgi:hypothetical protein